MHEEPISVDYERLLESLEELSDKSWQETAWLGLIPGVMAMFEEAVCSTGFTNFCNGLESGHVDTLYSAELCAKGRELSLLIDQTDPYMEVEELIESENMVKIREISAELAVMVKKEGRPRGGWFLVQYSPDAGMP